MITLFLRTIITYLIVFAVMRLMGKRQLSDMQPFDLVVTLLIADVASVPISDTGIPLFYGIVPITALFIMHRLVSFASLKSNGMRTLVCGSPVIVIANGTVQEAALRAANYTLSDLMEQLRLKDVFSVSEVSYGILETNGSLSVLKKQEGCECERPSVMLVSDGRVLKKALASLGLNEKWLAGQLKKLGVSSAEELLFAVLDSDGTLCVQEKLRSARKRPRMISARAINED